MPRTEVFNGHHRPTKPAPNWSFLSVKDVTTQSQKATGISSLDLKRKSVSVVPTPPPNALMARSGRQRSTHSLSACGTAVRSKRLRGEPAELTLTRSAVSPGHVKWGMLG